MRQVQHRSGPVAILDISQLAEPERGHVHPCRRRLGARWPLTCLPASSPGGPPRSVVLTRPLVERRSGRRGFGSDPLSVGQDGTAVDPAKKPASRRRLEWPDVALRGGRSSGIKVVDLGRRFFRIVRSRCDRQPSGRSDVTAFDKWLCQAQTCGVRIVKSFAASIGRDADAVRAALTLP